MTINYRGNFSAASTYAVGDVVIHPNIAGAYLHEPGTAVIALQAVAAGESSPFQKYIPGPDTANHKWGLLSLEVGFNNQFNYTGLWWSEDPYVQYDVAYHNSEYWVALINNSDTEPGVEHGAWYRLAQVVAQEGPVGPEGPAGPTGIQGVQGSMGDQGAQGNDGIQGLTGNAGNDGATGATGIQGITGLQGDQGIQGIQGLTGLQGSDGAQGIQGLTGTQGVDGDTGPQGPKGDDGASQVDGITVVNAGATHTLVAGVSTIFLTVNLSTIDLPDLASSQGTYVMIRAARGTAGAQAYALVRAGTDKINDLDIASQTIPAFASGTVVYAGPTSWYIG